MRRKSGFYGAPVELDQLLENHVPLPDGKVCSRCRRFRAIGEFYADKSKSDGRRPVCAQCDNARRRKKPKRPRHRRTVEELAQIAAARAARVPRIPLTREQKLERKRVINRRYRARKKLRTRAERQAQLQTDIETFRLVREAELKAAVEALSSNTSL